MRFSIVLAIYLGLTPSFGLAQEVEDKGELVLAYTTSFVTRVDDASITLTVWQSGFTEAAILNTGRFGPAPLEEVHQTHVSTETVDQLRKDLIHAGILKLQGSLTENSGSYLPARRRVTFIEHAPAWMHRFFERHPGLRTRFGAYLRPQVASFSLQRHASDNSKANFALGIIGQFLVAAFPDQDFSGNFHAFPLERVYLPGSRNIEEGNLILRNAQQWCELWDQLRSYSYQVCNEQAVDFDRKVVIVTALGERPSSCHQLSISDMKRDGTELKVVARETIRGEECNCYEYVHNPSIAFSIDKPVGRLEVIHEVVEQEECW